MPHPTTSEKASRINFWDKNKPKAKVRKEEIKTLRISNNKVIDNTEVTVINGFSHVPKHPIQENPGCI